MKPEQILERGRVAAVFGQQYRLLIEKEELLAQLTGSFLHQAESAADLPTVGDWVAVQRLAADQGVIHSVEERTAKFSRKIAGNRLDEQLIAANIDYLFVVSSLNDDFNVRRLERYFAAAQTCGAKPVAVLTKADLCAEPELFIVPLYELTTDIVVVGFAEDRGLEQLKTYLTAGKTGAFVGSSGVGKSTLINRLLAKEQLQVSAIRTDDSKGRHTTTHRELLPLSTGAFVIDTPGMREFQLFEEATDLDGAFADIAALAEKCRFRNCRHGSEIGCAVKTAIQTGSLAEARWLNYLKLQRELQFQERRQQQKERRRNKRK